MGQYAGQPDFATNSVKAVTPSDIISSATFLDSSIIYIGDNLTVGSNLKVITSGVTGVQGTVTAATIINGGTGYTTNAGVTVTPASGLGTGCTVDVTAVAGLVTAVTIATAGSNYRNGDVLTITGDYITSNAISTQFDLGGGNYGFFGTTFEGAVVGVNYTATFGTVPAQTLIYNMVGVSSGGGQVLITDTSGNPQPGLTLDTNIPVLRSTNKDAQIRINVTDLLPVAGDAVTFKGLGTGGFLPVTVDYVLATGTTVAELIAAR